MMKLSRAAEDALVNASSSRQGAVLPEMSAGVAAELVNAGLIGGEYGLTRKGTVERERVVTKRLEEAFG